MSGVKSRQSSYLRIALNPRSLLQHRRRHVPRLRRNVLHLCAEFFTFQYVHLHTEVTIMFLDMAPAFKYLSHSCSDVGIVSVKRSSSVGVGPNLSAIKSFDRRQSSNQVGRRRTSFPSFAVGQPTQIFEAPPRQSVNDLQFEEKLCMLRRRKSARSRSAPPSNNRNASPRLSKVSEWPRVWRAAVATSEMRPFLYAKAYTRNTSAGVDDSNLLRLNSARIKDWASSMSYFAAAESRDKILSLERGISGGTGYNIVIRLFKTSASSDRCTTGSSSGAASFWDWGRENCQQKRATMQPAPIYGPGN